MSDREQIARRARDRAIATDPEYAESAVPWDDLSDNERERAIEAWADTDILVTRLVHIQTRHMGRLQQALDDHVDRKERLYGLIRRWTNSRGCDGVRECASDLNHVLGDRDLPEQK